MTKETVRIDYIIRPEKLETPGIIAYIHFAEPIVCVDGEEWVSDTKVMIVRKVKAA